MSVRLSPLRAEHAARFQEMIAEYREHDEIGLYTGFYEEAWHGFDAYRTMLERLSAGGWPRPEIVPGETYFLMDGERIVGEIYLRFGLTEVLERDGGNVGYQIRPSARNRGYATKGLRLALDRLNGVGFAQALLTCAEGNAASIRVIEKNGGTRVADAESDDGTLNRRYLILTASKDEAAIPQT
ncbi:MAG: GNAT family N-acetyltransferase [Candidatus Cybelea sp.]